MSVAQLNPEHIGAHDAARTQPAHHSSRSLAAL